VKAGCRSVPGKHVFRAAMDCRANIALAQQRSTTHPLQSHYNWNPSLEMPLT
jgi:hypothetical protein